MHANYAVSDGPWKKKSSDKTKADTAVPASDPDGASASSLGGQVTHNDLVALFCLQIDCIPRSFKLIYPNSNPICTILPMRGAVGVSEGMVGGAPHLSSRL